MYITNDFKKVIFIVLLLNGCQNGKFLGLDEREWTIIGAVGAITATAYALCKGGKCKLPDSSNYYIPKKENNYLQNNDCGLSYPFSCAPTYKSFQGCCSHHKGLYRIDGKAICYENWIICKDETLSPTCTCYDIKL